MAFYPIKSYYIILIMSILKIKNDYSWLESNDVNLKVKLHQALRFRERGYYHSRLFKQGRWDGYTEFFKIKTGRFLTGLLPEVQAAIQILGRRVEIEDYREPINFAHESIDENFLNYGEEAVVLRDYQVDLINQVIKHKRGVVFAPTSAGKTHIMLGILKSLPPKTPTLFLCNRKSLVEQNYQEMIKWGLEDVGRLYDRYKEPNMITCSTIQSLHKIEDLLPLFKVLIVDEIHDMTSKKPKQYYVKLKGACIRIAVSATPFKFGEKDKSQKYTVKGHFGPVLKTKTADTKRGVLTTKKLQERNILSKSKCTFYPIDEPRIPYAIYQDAITEGIAENPHFHEIVTRLAKKLQGRTLILVERIAHGDALADMIPGALWIQGKDDLDTRQIVIEKLQAATDDTVAIATHQIFNTGINVFLHNLINAAGGKAEHLIIQRMGRGLRTADDKETLDYYDFVFNTNDYLLSHSKKRVKILKSEGHEVTVKEEIDF
jgi:superfamily II DNA or RNA helicase